MQPFNTHNLCSILFSKWPTEWAADYQIHNSFIFTTNWLPCWLCDWFDWLISWSTHLSDCLTNKLNYVAESMAHKWALWESCSLTEWHQLPPARENWPTALVLMVERSCDSGPICWQHLEVAWRPLRSYSSWVFIIYHGVILIVHAVNLLCFCAHSIYCMSVHPGKGIPPWFKLDYHSASWGNVSR